MKRKTKEWIEDIYGKIFLMAIIIIFALIAILGVWGFFGSTENTGKQKTNREITNSSP